MNCSHEDCDARVEASMPLWLNLDDDGWSIYGVGDDVEKIECTEGHDNWTPELSASLEAFLNVALPGTTFAASAEVH